MYKIQNVDKNLIFMIYKPVICRDKINKRPVRLYISYVLKYSASKYRATMKSLRMKSGCKSYILSLYVYNMKEHS
jgi:hypothetical protein